MENKVKKEHPIGHKIIIGSVIVMVLILVMAYCGKFI